MELSDQDYETNRSGFLTADQKKRYKRKANGNFALSVLFFCCSPASFIVINNEIGKSIFLLAFFVGAGLLFAWMGKEDRAISRNDSPCVNSIGGELKITIKGRNTILELGGKTFRVPTYGTKGLVPGKRYEFFYTGELKKIVGWKTMQ